MTKEKWNETADELIDRILDTKERVKDLQDQLEVDKTQLIELLEEHNLTEYKGTYGKANFVNFQREGIIKNAVIETVDDVNKGRVDHIDMKDLIKNINVNFINVREYADEC